MKHIFLLTSVFLFFLTAQAQLITEPIQTAKDTANGVFYALPKTLFNVEVTVQKKNHSPAFIFSMQNASSASKISFRKTRRTLKFPTSGFMQKP